MGKTECCTVRHKRVRPFATRCLYPSAARRKSEYPRGSLRASSDVYCRDERAEPNQRPKQLELEVKAYDFGPCAFLICMRKVPRPSPKKQPYCPDDIRF